MTSITSDSIVVRADQLLATDLDDETILMSIEKGAYYGMEQTARRVWQLLEKRQTVSDLCRQLAEEYSVTPEVCEQEVIAFLEELLKENLVVVE